MMASNPTGAVARRLRSHNHKVEEPEPPAVTAVNGHHPGPDEEEKTKISIRSMPTMPHKGGGSGVGIGIGSLVSLARRHPVLCAFALSVLFFMGVEYTLVMVPPTSPPLDIGFHLTRPLNHFLAKRPALNSALAALNTVFVFLQTTYILWCLVVEGRPRPSISALFMFTCRGVLGYSTQLPLPQDFLGSGMDFPVGNVSFFLFYSGHVAASVIASLDMRRVKRHEMAWAFDILNVLQALRLLATRGHYTIDLAVGVGAGVLFDTLAGKYEDRYCTNLPLPPAVDRKHQQSNGSNGSCYCCCGGLLNANYLT